MHSVFFDLLLADFPPNLNRQLDRTGSQLDSGEKATEGDCHPILSFSFTHSDLT